MDHVFVFMKYGQNDLLQKAVKSIYGAACKDPLQGLGIMQMKTRYSLPTNIQDLVTKTELHQATGKEEGRYYLGEQCTIC